MDERDLNRRGAGVLGAKCKVIVIRLEHATHNSVQSSSAATTTSWTGTGQLLLDPPRHPVSSPTTWSLCTWVRNTAESAYGGVPASIRRMTVERPASNCRAISPYRTSTRPRPGQAEGDDAIPVRITFGRHSAVRHLSYRGLRIFEDTLAAQVDLVAGTVTVRSSYATVPDRRPSIQVSRSWPGWRRIAVALSSGPYAGRGTGRRR